MKTAASVLAAGMISGEDGGRLAGTAWATGGGDSILVQFGKLFEQRMRSGSNIFQFNCFVCIYFVGF
ncbi:unnamed protein product [Cuscuta campestris]|uniref:Uncharacterized protein n=1 Tax=Cuscuta campestris TaxID=132261 RepID=A0A484MRM6_9ASTE|nr:unnamed protein product [Cuscuta campestris]